MEETIALAARHVLEARKRVIQQQQRVRALEGLGVDTRYHEYTLKVFRQTLQVFEEHQRIIEERLKMLSGEISSPGVGSDA